MSVQFKKERVTIPKGTGTKTIPGSVRFDSRVVTREIVIAGFKFNYRSKDHHIDEIQINIVHVGRSPPDDKKVLFQLECRYEDKNHDDSWDGYVDVVVMAEVE